MARWHRLLRSLSGGLVLTSVLTVAGTPSGSAATGVPEIVQRASSVYAHSVAGLVGMQRHFKTVIGAGPVHHTEESDSAVLFNDGVFVDAAYYRIVDDGRPISQTDLNKRTAQTVEDWRAGRVFFKEPYDPHFMSDYRFQPPTKCNGCPANAVAVQFDSSIRDMQHGSGTLIIDGVSGRVLSLTYAPNALPPHATSGEITEVSGEPIDGLWYVTRIEQKYQGKYAIFHGSGTFSGSFDHFRRFANSSTAEAALRDAKL